MFAFFPEPATLLISTLLEEAATQLQYKKSQTWIRVNNQIFTHKPENKWEKSKMMESERAGSTIASLF